jgi:Metallo-beta-lactamase superfamily
MMTVMAEAIHEAAPGVLHWSARHPSAGIDSASHLLTAEGILIDPIAPGEGIEALDDRGVTRILLTNRHHTRSAFEIQDRLKVPILAPQPGMHDLPADRVQPYEHGAEVVSGIRAHAISETWPDETALEIPAHRAVAIADGITNYDGLGFFADHLLGDDPEAEKQRLREGFARLVEAVAFEHLLFAHGPPIIGNGREALRAFVQ